MGGMSVGGHVDSGTVCGGNDVAPLKYEPLV